MKKPQWYNNQFYHSYKVMNRNKHYHLHYTKEEKEEEVKLYFIKTSNKGEIAYKNNKEE